MSDTGHILVVDDDPQLLPLMERFLRRSGFEVTGFANAASAIAFYTANHSAVDLAVIDLTLPDIPGDAAALKMAEIEPGIRVIICSGFPWNPESVPQQYRANFSHVHKPFLPKELIAAVQALLAL